MLKINELFYSIQGEGPFMGRPAIFIRLSGCNLACDFCDTQHHEGLLMQEDDIAEQVRALSINPLPGLPARRSNLVVITGGEPLAQNIEQLVRVLLKAKFIVQIESNGSINPYGFKDWAFVQLVVSPKPGASCELVNFSRAVKFVVKDGQQLPPATLQLAQDCNIPVYIQPVDEKDNAQNMKNAKWAAALAMRYGFSISLQMQKILDIR